MKLNLSGESSPPSQQGATMVEMALALLLFVHIVLAIVDFVHVLFVHAMMAGGLERGLRKAATINDLDLDLTELNVDQAVIQDRWRRFQAALSQVQSESAELISLAIPVDEVGATHLRNFINRYRGNPRLVSQPNGIVVLRPREMALDRLSNPREVVPRVTDDSQLINLPMRSRLEISPIQMEARANIRPFLYFLSRPYNVTARVLRNRERVFSSYSLHVFLRFGLGAFA